jgi:hypothetical protein
MSFTQGQTQKLRTINKASFTGLAPARQVTAIASWIQANNTFGGLEVFPTTKDKGMADYVEAIGEHLGIYTGHPSFQAGLRAFGSGGVLYRDAVGAYGRVPSAIVQSVCEKYRIQQDVVARACGTYAAAQGANGIKVLASHGTYQAELKLLAMGGERIYAKNQVGGKYVFDTVAKHT